MADDTYTVQRSASIQAPPERIYPLVANFHHWPQWSPWEDLDPNLQRTYSGAQVGAGAVYSWSGNRRAGKGRMEIVEATEPVSVGIDLVFEKPWKARNDTRFTIAADEVGSRVVWSMTGKKTLLTKAMGLFKSMESFLGPDFEKGLARLKAAAEQPAAS